MNTAACASVTPEGSSREDAAAVASWMTAVGKNQWGGESCRRRDRMANRTNGSTTSNPKQATTTISVAGMPRASMAAAQSNTPVTA